MFVLEEGLRKGLAVLGVEGRGMRGQLAGRPAVSDQQNLAEVDDTTDPMDKEATEALPATQLEIDNHHFRLRGIRTQQLAGRRTKTTQYRVVLGNHPNRSDSWVNEDDVQIHQASLLPKKRRVKCHAGPDEERWLFVGGHRCCPPSPEPRDDPGSLFDEAERVVLLKVTALTTRHPYCVLPQRGKAVDAEALHRRGASRLAATTTVV